MTNQELDRRCAVEVMGWHNFEGSWHDWNGETRVCLGYWVYPQGDDIHAWSPSTNANHTRMLLEKLSGMELDCLTEDIYDHIKENDSVGKIIGLSAHMAIMGILLLPLPTLCALILEAKGGE